MGGGQRPTARSPAAAVPPKFNRYIEPFAGAGAVFFRLYNLGLIGANPRLRTVPAILNDFNGELMTVYQVVRDHLDELIDELARHQVHVNDPDYYYYVRNLDREPDFRQWPAPVRAARTIFLNKTGYNGLYRVNQSGYFNVPFGRYTRPTVLDHAVLKAAQQALQRVDLMCSDFAQPLRAGAQRRFHLRRSAVSSAKPHSQLHRLHLARLRLERAGTPGQAAGACRPARLLRADQ